MANVKISELTALTPPDAADLVPVTDSSASQTKRTTVGEVVGIINGDVDVANDGTATISELPVSKLQDGTARQLLQTDAAGTGVEWTSNVDVPGTLDVTSTATFDSIAQHPLGSAAAPTLTFTGDPNTGIYSPGADQVAVATNGTGRLFVDADGNVGIGDPSSITGLELSGDIQIKYAGINSEPGGSRYLIFNNTDTTLVNDQPLGGISWVNNDASATAGQAAFVKAYTASNTGSAYLTFGTGGQNAATEQFRITTAGQLLLGTTSDSGGALLQIADDRIRITTAKTPASATDTGTAGEICWDADYVYVCTATNTWKRSAISTW
jgi:hypothetical protein